MASALLGTEPAELPVAQLVRLTGLFGISENRARVALSRMVSAGEATTDGAGRYRLAGHLVARQMRQSRSRSGLTDPYDGNWVVVVVTTSGSAAEVRGPAGAPSPTPAWPSYARGCGCDRPTSRSSCPARWMTTSSAWRRGPPIRSDWSSGCGTSHAWSAEAEALLAALDALAPEGPDALAPGFELSAAVLRHLQADPLLPAELLPEGWPGDRLRTTYDGWDTQYRATLSVWSRDA